MVPVAGDESVDDKLSEQEDRQEVDHHRDQHPWEEVEQEAIRRKRAAVGPSRPRYHLHLLRAALIGDAEPLQLLLGEALVGLDDPSLLPVDRARQLGRARADAAVAIEQEVTM